MKKKLVLFLLVGILLIQGAFAGGSQEAGETDDGRVNILYSFWGTPDEGAAVQAVADKFTASQDRIKVEVLSIPHDNYDTRLNIMATAKELPDCGIMSEAGVLQYAENGLLYDVSNMYAAGDSKPLDSLTFKFDNTPVAYSAANEILLMYYNKDMFDAAGVDYPPVNAADAWSWDEFVSTAKLLTLDSKGNNANSPDFNPNNIVQYGCMIENLTWQLEVWCLSNGSGFYSEDGSEVTINDSAAIDAIQKIADLHLVEHVAPLSAGLTDDGVQRSLIAGTCAMTTNGAWNVGTCLASARDEGLNYGVAVLPYMKERVTICTGGPQVVFSQTEHPEEAMEWIKWYLREENSWALIESGIWMPILDKWYTDEALTRKWVENPNFPDYNDYKSAVVDYAKDYSRSTSWYYVNNTVDFNTLLGSLLGEVWTGNKTAKEAINGGYNALLDAREGNG